MSKKLILPSLASLLFLNAHLLAEEIATENTETLTEEHVSVRSREIDTAKRDLIREMRAKQQELEETESSGAQAEQAALYTDLKPGFASSSFRQWRLAPREMIAQPQISLATNPYPINCHWLTSISDNNHSIEMEDGSHWEVSTFDFYVLQNWRREDSLVITPNYSWLSPYDYYITNKNNNTYVKANLHIGPIRFGPFSHWIVDIDYFNGHVYLENQMVWCISPRDSNVLNDWIVNDHIIFGLYDSWVSPYDHILINASADDHVRAKQY